MKVVNQAEASKTDEEEKDLAELHEDKLDNLLESYKAKMML